MTFIFIIMTLFFSSIASAGVPEVVHPQTGQPVVWQDSTTIPYNIDQGPLGLLSNAQAKSLVESMMWVWENVPTAVIHFEDRGPLDQDATANNLDNYLGKEVCTASKEGSGWSPIIFDNSGEIIDLLAGEGASQKIVGKSAFRCYAGSIENPLYATQAFVVMNGKFIDGESDVEDLDLNSFTGVILHELGHYLGLHHSMINESLYEEIRDGERSFDDTRYLPVMFPLVLANSKASTVLKPDDVAMISHLYPTESSLNEEGVIQGSVFDRDGEGVYGANVIARNVDDPLCEAVSAISGRNCSPMTNDQGEISVFGTHCNDSSQRGAFKIVGLQAGNYTVEVSEVAELGDSRGSMFPKNSTVSLPGNAEFYNDTDFINEESTKQSVLDLSTGEALEYIDIWLDGDNSESRSPSIDLTVFGIPIYTHCALDNVAYGDLIESADLGVNASNETGGTSNDTSSQEVAGCQLMKGRALSGNFFGLIIVVGMCVVARFRKREQADC